MTLANKKVAVVGGGPGGLTLAKLLQLKNVDVKVYERDAGSTARQQGATLDLHEGSGLDAIRKAGLEKEFHDNYRPGAGKMKVAGKNAAVYLDDHANPEFDDSRPEIDRGPLRNILMHALQQETIVWNSQFEKMEKCGAGWTLFFKNGTTAYADIVVAADGANSRIRPYITGIPPIYSGVTIIEGNVYHAAQNAPALWSLVNGGKVFALGDEQTLILSAKGDGSLSFYTGCKVPENWVAQSNIDFSNKAAALQWFKTDFAAWGDIFRELFASDESWFVPRPQYYYPVDQHWESLPNLTMIGDAAHRIPPYAGEGANMAMQDAVELAESLTSGEFPDVQSAISYFEKQMLKRLAVITQETLDATENLHSFHALDWLTGLFKRVRE